jgi:hypothetical protein
MSYDSEAQGRSTHREDEAIRPAEEAPAEGAISVALAQRLVIFLLAAWNVFAGLSLVVFQGASSASLGAGIEDEAAQRLIGVHMLILAPVFFMLAWKPEKYGAFLWLAYLSQAAIAAATAFDLVAGNRDVGDGTLPLVVALLFLALLVYVWVAGRRVAERVLEPKEEPTGSGGPGEDGGSIEHPGH